MDENLFTDSKFKTIIENLKILIGVMSNRDIPNDYFTPHDYSHCLAVEEIVDALIIKSEIFLTEMENFILYASIWTHDIGMYENVAQEYYQNYDKKHPYSLEQKRHDHDKISAYFINHDQSFKKVFTDQGVSEDKFQNYVNTISIINKYHRRKQNVEDCPEYRFIKKERIRSRLIACLVRLGDTLHIDSSRYDSKLFNILQIGYFDRTARLHWLKSYLISTINLDIDKQTIYVTIDLPECSSKEERSNWEEKAKRLKFIIHEDIYEDVLAVSETFRENNLNFYNVVKINVDFCPGFDHNKREEISNIINDLDIVLSPNTTTVIEKSLDSISSLLEIDFKSYQYFYNQIRQLKDHLEYMSKKKFCHIGLITIYQRLKDVFNQFPLPNNAATLSDINACKDQLSTICNEIRESHKLARDTINKKATAKLDGVEHVFLFGYSKTVFDFLCSNKNVNFKQEVQLHIFECSVKRRLSITNNIEYDDGIYYATNLSNAGFKNIEILPDSTFPSLLNDIFNIKSLDYSSIPEQKNSILLFGTNGINNDDSCGNTSGHLIMALIAEHYKVPVIVIAERFKKGHIPWDASAKRDETQWLTGQKDLLAELKDKNIKISNYLTDRITSSLITEIITD